jgi:hypothetical protein
MTSLPVNLWPFLESYCIIISKIKNILLLLENEEYLISHYYLPIPPPPQGTPQPRSSVGGGEGLLKLR